MRNKAAKLNMKELTIYKGNSARVKLRKNTNDGMEPLTSCQANRITVTKRTVRRHEITHKLTSVVVRRDKDGLVARNHLHPVKPMMG